ncbi:MAG: hypothetical protein IT445_09565 [Phycisphaeraceae bacterium]|nr:hypothetical protein [Phycisphaeraceae bacterium]
MAHKDFKKSDEDVMREVRERYEQRKCERPRMAKQIAQVLRQIVALLQANDGEAGTEAKWAITQRGGLFDLLEAIDPLEYVRVSTPEGEKFGVRKGGSHFLIHTDGRSPITVIPEADRRFSDLYANTKSIAIPLADSKYVEHAAERLLKLSDAWEAWPEKVTGAGEGGMRSAPMSKTELARRIQDRRTARPRDVDWDRFDLQPFSARKYTVNLNAVGVDNAIRTRLQRPI